MTREPEPLKTGKAFHRTVQRDWDHTAGGNINIERTTPLLSGSTRTGRRRRGRMDILVDELDGCVTVVEIKATDWDRILPRNRQRNLASHRRQVWRYIAKYLDAETLDICAGIIYPAAPSTPGLKDQVEEYLNEHGLQVVWYYD